MTYQIQIKFMNFQRRYLVRIIQLLSFNVVVILLPTAAFAAFHFQLFAFPYAFQFEQGDQHSPSQTSAKQYSSETNQLLSLSPGFNLFSYNIFSFELGVDNHQVRDHR